MEHIGQTLHPEYAYFKKDKYGRPIFLVNSEEIDDLKSYCDAEGINSSIMKLDGGEFEDQLSIIVSNFDGDDIPDGVRAAMYKDNLRFYIPRKFDWKK